MFLLYYFDEYYVNCQYITYSLHVFDFIENVCNSHRGGYFAGKIPIFLFFPGNEKIPSFFANTYQSETYIMSSYHHWIL